MRSLRSLQLMAAILAATVAAPVALAQTNPSTFTSNGATTTQNGFFSPVNDSPQQYILSATPAVACVDNSAVLNSNGFSTVGISVSGSWTGTIGFFGETDTLLGYVPLPVFPQANGVSSSKGGGPGVATVTGDGIWFGQVAGYVSVCAYLLPTSAGGGTIAGSAIITLRMSRGGRDGTLPSPVQGFPLEFPVQSNITQVGTQNALAGAGGPSIIPGVGVSPRVGISSDSNMFGPSSRQTFTTSAAITVPTSAANLAAIETPAGFTLRLHYLKVCLDPTALQTTAGLRTLYMFKTTAASSGGSAITTTQQYDPNDPPFAGVLRTGALTSTPSAPTLAANSILSWTLALPSAVTTNTSTQECFEHNFDQFGTRLPTASGQGGAGQGLAIRDNMGGAGGTGNYIVDAVWTLEPIQAGSGFGPAAQE